MMHYFRIIFSLLGVLCSLLFGNLDGLLLTLIIFTSIDYASGVIAAIIKKKLNSTTGYKGLLKKMLIYCIVSCAYLLDMYILKQGSVLRSAVIFYYVANEGISIIENLSRCGVPVPKKLKDVLEQLKKEG